MSSETINEGQRESIGGMLGSFKDFANWAGEHPKRTVIGVITLFVVAPLAILIWNFPWFAEKYDQWSSRELTRQLADRDNIRTGEEIDRQLGLSLQNLRLRHAAPRGVVRAYVVARDDASQIIAVVDVFESMDAQTEALGIRSAELPLAAISGTTAYMMADPFNPRCIARNREEYEDVSLRQFLERAGLKASVACPIVDLSGQLLGLVALSSRTPLERNIGMQRDVRDTALMFSGYWMRSPKVQSAIERAQDAQQ